MTKQTDKKKDEVEQSVEDTQSKCVSDHTACQAEILQFKNMYLRALADYKNLENRTEQEKARIRNLIKRQFAEVFLSIVDDIGKAQIFSTDPGLKMVSDKFVVALKSLGLTSVPLLGETYDPYKAEVVETVNGEEDDMITEVLQEAYALDGEIIRPGKVKVSKKKKTDVS